MNHIARIGADGAVGFRCMPINPRKPDGARQGEPGESTPAGKHHNLNAESGTFSVSGNPAGMVATVNLDGASYEALKDIASRRGLNDDLGAALAFALADERYIAQQLAAGRRILVDEDGKLKEVDFKR